MLLRWSPVAVNQRWMRRVKEDTLAEHLKEMDALQAQFQAQFDAGSKQLCDSNYNKGYNVVFAEQRATGGSPSEARDDVSIETEEGADANTDEMVDIETLEDNQELQFVSIFAYLNFSYAREHFYVSSLVVSRIQGREPIPFY